jgi:hypothetical protein
MSDENKKNHLEVAIVTTGGTFPESGFDEVALEQPIKVALSRAERALKLTNTADWIATSGNPSRELNVESSYRANHLSGQVYINWGPPQRGGGANVP